MAIAIIVLTVALIAPPLFIATATRVQNRRVEQAFQLAQGEIDRIQVLMSQGENTVNRLPFAVSDLDTQVPPGGPAPGILKTPRTSCPGVTIYQDQQIPVNQALPVDSDGDCAADFYMQTFRTQGSIPALEQSRTASMRRYTDFEVEVRVYSALVAQHNTWAQLEQDQINLNLTSGQGSQRKRPLVVLNNRMSWSDQTFSLCEMRRNLGGPGC